MTPVLAVDWGEKRVGVAVSDPSMRLARSLPTLRVTGLRDAVRAVADLARREEAAEILIGLPLLPSGDEGESARRARKLGASLAARGFAVRYLDERHTSTEADALLAGRGETRPAAGRRDAVAAALLLQEYLDAARGTGSDA